MQIKFNECNTAYLTFYKSDYGQILEVDSVPDNSEVHFPVKDSQNAVVVKVVNNQCEIPKSTLTLDMSSFDAWLYVDNGTSGKTKKRIHFTLIQRAKPDSHIYNPNDEQMLNYNNKLDKFQGKENEGKTFIVDSEGNANLSDLQEITIDTELSKESNNAIANSAVAKVLLGGKLLKTIFVKSDEEFENVLINLTEKLAELSPIMVIFGYDAIENFGFGMGEGAILFDSGNGNFEEALVIPVYPSEVAITQENYDHFSKAYDFVDKYYRETCWKELKTFLGAYADGTTLAERPCRVIQYRAKILIENLLLHIYALNLPGCSGVENVSGEDFGDVVVEGEWMDFALEISMGDSFYIIDNTLTSSKGSKTIHKKRDVDYLNKFHITGMSSLNLIKLEPKNIQSEEAYGKR